MAEEKKEVKKGVKYLITGFENTGKTTLLTGVKDSLIISVDDKPFGGNVPHYSVDSFKTVRNFEDTLMEKMKKYKAKFKKFPKVIIIDTITKLYEKMHKQATKTATGFGIFNAVQDNTLAINDLTEKLVKSGFDIIISAHLVYDENTGKYNVPAVGQFKTTGSWLSVVDEASYLFFDGDDRMIAHKKVGLPCRSTLDLKEEEEVSEFDINKHLQSLRDKSLANQEFEL